MRQINAFTIPYLKQLTKKIRDTCFLHDGCIPMVVREESDAIYFAKNIKEGIVPIFYVSNLQACSLDNLKKFLNMLPYPETVGSSTIEKALFITHNKFQIDGKIVFIGFLHKGVIRKHQKLFIGPLSDGSFE